MGKLVGSLPCSKIDRAGTKDPNCEALQIPHMKVEGFLMETEMLYKGSLDVFKWVAFYNKPDRKKIKVKLYLYL